MNFFESSLSAREYLNEMPHFKTKKGYFHDLHLEDHIYDSPEEFIKYIINIINSYIDYIDVINYIKQDNFFKEFVIKYYGSKIYNQIIQRL